MRIIYQKSEEGRGRLPRTDVERGALHDVPTACRILRRENRYTSHECILAAGHAGPHISAGYERIESVWKRCARERR